MQWQPDFIVYAKCLTQIHVYKKFEVCLFTCLFFVWIHNSFIKKGQAQFPKCYGCLYGKKHEFQFGFSEVVSTIWWATVDSRPFDSRPI